MTRWRCPDLQTQKDMDAALEGLTKHGMVAAGVCRCGGGWPCATALDLTAQAALGCHQLQPWPGRS